jgi:hypothetical protein
MSYYRHRFFIIAFALSLPFVLGLAFLQDPFVSKLLLNFSLKVVRIQTGLRVETQDWNVSPFRFAVSFRNVKVQVGNLAASTDRMQFQFSPLYLVIGRLQLKNLTIENSELAGILGIDWNKKDSDSSPEEIPNKVAQSLEAINQSLRERNIGYEDLKLINARIGARDLKAFIPELTLQNLERGQMRIQGSAKQVELPGHIGLVESVDLSALILRQGQKKYYAALRKIELSLSGKDKVSVSGRWPGDLKLQVKGELEDLDKWILKSPEIKDWDAKLAPKGLLNLDATLQFREKNSRSLFANLEMKNFWIDGYNPGNVSLELNWDGQSWLFRRFAMELPRTNWEPQTRKNLILLDGLKIHGKKLTGQLRAEEAGLCGILRAASVEDCFVNLYTSGVVELSGDVESFEIVGVPKLQVSAFDVYADPKMFKQEASGFVLKGKPARVDGLVRLHAKDMDLENVRVHWDEANSGLVNGKIIYKPTVANLKASLQDLDLSKVVDNFAGVSVGGKISAQSVIDYVYNVPDPKTRTKVTATLQGSGMAVLGQSLGQMSGEFKYDRKKLSIGPVLLQQGGGRAHALGQIYSRPGLGSWMKLDVLFDQYEWQFQLDEETVPVHGYWSGSLAMKGVLDLEHPQQLRGPLELTGRNLKAFRYPFSSARLSSEAYVNRLLIREMLVFKEEGSFAVKGELNANKSELQFNIHPMKIRNLNLYPDIEKVFESGILTGSGEWSSVDGWALDTSISQARIGKRNLPTIFAKAKGNERKIEGDFRAAKQEGAFAASKRNNAWLFDRLKLTTEEEGLLILFSLLNVSQAQLGLESRGKLHYEWTPQRGSIATDNLALLETIDRTEHVLASFPGKQRLSWDRTEATGELRSNQGSMIHVDAKGCAGCLKVDGSLSAAFVDLLVPDILRFHSGHFDIDGKVKLPLTDDSLEISSKIQDVGFSVKTLGQPVERTRGRLLLSSEKIEVVQASGMMGSGRVDFSGTYRWLAQDKGLLLNAQLQKAQLVLLNEYPLMLDGTLQLAGPRLPYLLRGQVFVLNGLYPKEFGGTSLPVGLVQTQPPSILFDLKAEISNSFQIKNSLASAPVFGTIVIGGDDNSPHFTGNLNLDRGFLYARDQTFTVTRGSASFQKSVVPAVALQANTSVRYNNSDYRIDLLASGQASDMKFDFKSEPPLSTQDIISLLAFGFIRSDLEKNELANSGAEGSGLIQTAGFEAFQAVFGKKLGSNVSKTTGFQVSLGTKINNSQQDPVTKVEVTRKLGKKTTATFGRSLNLDKAENNLQVDYRLFKNMNLTGVWESPEPEEQSMGADIRFKFDLK